MNLVEVERKYDVGDGFTIPDLDGVAGCVGVAEATRYELVARYFDTADLRLAALNITLRRRTGGSDAGWTLKLPGGGDARRELSMPLETGQPHEHRHTVPADMAALVAGHVRGRPLTPVADLTTVRLEQDLLGAGGVVLAKLADDTVAGHRLDADANPTSVTTWRELEVELASGSQMSLKTVGKHLRRHGARRSTSPSKLSRVLNAALATPERPRTDRSAGGALVAYVRTHTDRLLAIDPMVRFADCEDDSVHQMRVAARSIYYALQTHRRLVDVDQVSDLRTELRWLADMLGTVRDLEVMRIRFAARLADFVDADKEPPWMMDLGRREAQARDHLRKHLLSARYFALLDTLDGFVTHPPLTSPAADRKDSREARTVLTSSLRRMSRAESAIAGTVIGEERDTALHLLRKRAKRGLHDADAANVLGIAPLELTACIEHLEVLLGSYRDGVIAQHQLQRIALQRATTKRDAYNLGQLAGIERCAADQILEGFPAAWQDVAAFAEQPPGRNPR